MHPRAFQWLDLALNPVLSARAARAVARALDDPRISVSLGPELRFMAKSSLHELHPQLCARPRRPAPLRGRTPRVKKSWTPPPPEVIDDALVADFRDTWAPAVGELFSRRLGAQTAAWQVAFSIADEFDGTFAELADAALAIVAN